MTAPDDFGGQVAVVTGGSRGIGLETARALAARGADVVVASRRLDACQRVADELGAEHGVRTLALATNVSAWDDCDRLVEATYDTFGRLDVLVNNAGLSPLYDDLSSVSAALFDKVIAVNLRGPFRLMALAGTMMAERDGGSIVNIGSVAAVRPELMALPYSAAKAGLHVLTEGFAQALAPKVRVNTVHPGPVLTDIAEHWTPEHEQGLASTVALRRCATPDEVVGAILYFASSASSYTTGAVLRVDGGWP